MLGKRSGSDFFKSVWNVQYKLKELGCKQIDLVKEDKITVKQFSDGEGKEGTYLLAVSKTPEDRSDHLTCVIDGVLYDTWDSSNQYIEKIFIPP